MKKPIFKISSKEFIFFLCFTIAVVMISIFTIERFPLTITRIEKELPVAVSEKKTIPLEKQTFPKFKAVARSNFLTNPEQAFFVDIIPREPIPASVYRLEIIFDPQIISIEEILAGNFFDQPQILRRDIDNQKGIIDFSAGMSISEKEAVGELQNKNSLITLKAKIKPQEQDQFPLKITFSFGERTLIIGEKERFENSSLLIDPIILQP